MFWIFWSNERKTLKNPRLSYLPASLGFNKKLLDQMRIAGPDKKATINFNVCPFIDQVMAACGITNSTQRKVRTEKSMRAQSKL